MEQMSRSRTASLVLATYFAASATMGGCANRQPTSEPEATGDIASGSRAKADLGHEHHRDKTRFNAKSRGKKTCLVLSAGGADGLAHIGAIRAAKNSGLRIDCVVGTSMGALIGGLYASSPASDPAQRYREFFRLYEEQTKSEASERGFLGAILLGGLAVLTGGAALAVVGAAGIGAAGGAATIDPVQLERMAKVYDTFVNSARIETLPVRFATVYVDTSSGSIRYPIVRSGPLSEGVKRSVANPLIFKNFDAAKAGYLDPGVDRLASTPVDEACREFPDAQLLAVNASGGPVATSDSNCPILLVTVQHRVKPEEFEQAMMGTGAAFNAAVAAGYSATESALRSSGRRPAKETAPSRIWYP